MVEAARQAIDAGLQSFCREEGDFTMSAAMRRSAVDHILAQTGIFEALQAERDKERDAVVAWLRKRAEILAIPGASPADLERVEHAKAIFALFADAIAANQHRSAEHV